MKKCICRLIVLVIMVLAVNAEAFADIAINEVNFPDAEFRSYVSRYCDTDSNGSLSNEEIASVKRIYVQCTSISSLKGIEYFTALIDLKCWGNSLTTLDVSNNTALIHLDCESNQLTELDLSRNTALTELLCRDNRLMELDLSHNTALTSLSCGSNHLTELDVSNNTSLMGLICCNNQLTELDVSSNTSLCILWCDFTITSADNNFEFNIADFMRTYQDFMRTYQSSDNNLLSIDFRYYYSDESNSLEPYPNLRAAKVPLDINLIAANNIVRFAIPEGKTFRYICMGLTYSNSSNEFDKYVYVYPFSGYSSGTTDPDTSNIAPIITTTDLPNGITDTPYTATIALSGDVSATWSLSGDLPNGLALSSDGTIMGTPTEGGIFTFTVIATNSEGSDSHTYTLTVNFSSAIAPTIITDELIDGLTGAPYGCQLKATSTSPITWSADILPDGLTLSTSGFLSGTPKNAGTFSFTVQAKNSASKNTATLTLEIVAAPTGTAPSITTDALNAAAIGQAYSFQLMASGTPPFSWSVKGKMPDGLSLSSSGLITGTPTKKGKKNITVIVENALGSAKKKLTLSTYDLPEITTQDLKEATVNKKYSMALKSKGTKPLTWELEGTLPDGITFDANKGKFSGTPTANGTYPIRITLRNSEGLVAKVYTLTVKAIKPTIKTTKIKAGKYGKIYSFKPKVKGTEPITFSLSGKLPAGLSFDTSTGEITGTPEEACTDQKLTLTATNTGGSATQEYSLTIKGVAPKITTKSLPNATVGTAYSTDVTATGSPIITWKASGLPQGLSMTTKGNISGTPSKSGKFSVKVTAENSSKTAKKSYKLTVTAVADKNNAGIQETAENSHNMPEVMTQKVSHDTLRPNNEAAGNISITNGGNDAIHEEYVIIAEFGTISVDKAGMYDFSVTLSDDVPAGKELVYLAGSSDPSDDDVIAEFYDESGEETDCVPESRTLTVSVWLDKDRIYTSSIAVKR